WGGRAEWTWSGRRSSLHAPGVKHVIHSAELEGNEHASDPVGESSPPGPLSQADPPRHVRIAVELVHGEFVRMEVHDCGPTAPLDRTQSPLEHEAGQDTEITAACNGNPEAPVGPNRDRNFENSASVENEMVWVDFPVCDPVMSGPHWEDRRIGLEANVCEHLERPKVVRSDRKILGPK